jgi:hypothetical protein
VASASGPYPSTLIGTVLPNSTLSGSPRAPHRLLVLLEGSATRVRRPRPTRPPRSRTARTRWGCRLSGGPRRRGCPALPVRCDADWSAVALGRPLLGLLVHHPHKVGHRSHLSTSLTSLSTVDHRQSTSLNARGARNGLADQHNSSRPDGPAQPRSLVVRGLPQPPRLAANDRYTPCQGGVNAHTRGLTARSVANQCGEEVGVERAGQMAAGISLRTFLHQTLDRSGQGGTGGDAIRQ